jgi:ketosteroid isomerase-like protein
MSQENVERLRPVYKRWESGDFWTPEIFDPNVEVVWSPDMPDVGIYHGLAGLENGLREWFSAWDVVRMEADEFIDIDAARILVLVSAYGRGQSSGIEVAVRDYAHAWTMRNGRAIKLAGYANRADAFRAVGLRE